MVAPGKRPCDEIRSQIEGKIMDLLEDYELWMVLAQFSDVLDKAARLMDVGEHKAHADTAFACAEKLAELAGEAQEQNL